MPMLSLRDKLRHHLTMAQTDTERKPAGMRCLTDEPSHKLALKLYKEYIGLEKMAQFPNFMHALDALLAKFGGGKPEDAEPHHRRVRDDEDEGTDDNDND